MCLCWVLCTFFCRLWAQQEPDYTQGVFILNEDWFGHQNSSINFLHENGQWEYRVFQKENPGRELGCTSQYGTVFNGRMYIISKQERDMGASITGGRITVCDAKTMKCIAQLQNIATDSNGNSMADGRGFVGVNPQKGYISTSNGIYVFNLETLQVKGMIAGTGSEGAGLYSAQCGMMISYGNRVFAVHQKKGLLVIDAENDTIVRVVGAPVDREDGSPRQRGFGSIVQSKDSMMWLSVAADVSGRGSIVDYFFRFDPESLDTTRILLPQGYGLPSSWYAWTADAFCASVRQNKLYWKKQGDGWFSNSQIVCYDIDKDECYDFFDSQQSGWYMYCGAGFRVHPQTDEMYVSLYLDNLRQTYQTVRLNPGGELLASYEMIDNYWFPAMVIFPETLPVSPGLPENPDTLSVKETALLPLKLYPNPAAGTVYVNGDYAQVRIYDLSGRLVRSYAAQSRIPVSGLRSGIYVFYFTDARGRKAVRKVVVQ